MWGALATGIFAVAVVGGKDGLLAGDAQQFVSPCIGAFSAIAQAFILTFVLALAVERTSGLRVTEEEEYVELDISQHGERIH